MVEKWKVLYYETSDGKSPVEEFINSRSIENQVKIFALISYLEDQGPNLPRPYADTLKDGIHELRIKLSGDQTRILYFFCYRQYIILTHSFIKKTSEVPGKEIKRAISIREDFLSRYTEKDLFNLTRSDNEDI